MDSSQITGATSSYARKYCLNGLFNIDDTKEADSHNQNQNQPNTVVQTTKYNGNNGSGNNGNNGKSSVQHQPQIQIQGISKEQLDWLQCYCQSKGYTDDNKKELMKFYRFSPKTTTPEQFVKIQKQIEADDAAKISVIPA